MPQSQPYTLVLTGRPGAAAVTEAVVAAVSASVSRSSPVVGRWLAPGDAWDIDLNCPSAGDAAQLRQNVARSVAPAPIDVNVVPGHGKQRRARLLVADMDSTIIEQECIDEMADVLGLKPRIAAITERAMRGELAFAEALTERLALLAGISEAQLLHVYEDRVTLMSGAKVLLATMRAHGAYTALVSGGFTFFTSRVAAKAGFHETRANTLEMVDGKLTGRPVLPILGKEAKRATLEELRQTHGVPSSATLAVGDGANDLDMIAIAGLGVAYRAKPVVAAAAAAAITHGDLTALLYLQGYTAAEFAQTA